MLQNFISYFPETEYSVESFKAILDPFSTEPPDKLVIKASDLLQHKLTLIDHNFGLDPNKKSRPIGKMFGVLVVKDTEDKLGYLSAFSGKLKGGNHYEGFVPPVYDGLQEGGFLNKGMTQLSIIVNQVRAIQEENNPNKIQELESLKLQRKNHSQKLQQKLFESYHFLNSRKESKSLIEIFADRQPQGGSGECAAPKLLQYAFANNLTPIAIGEFWWGISPKSQHRIHKEFYPACEEKCRRILGWMLG